MGWLDGYRGGATTGPSGSWAQRFVFFCTNKLGYCTYFVPKSKCKGKELSI